MHKIVYTCFKSIAFAMIFIIVWDVGFYLWRVNTLNDRIESVAVSMQEVITKNNYIPGYETGMSAESGEHAMFKEILKGIRDDMNTGETFITRIGWNSVLNSTYNPALNGTPVIRKTRDPASYGSVMVLQIEVEVKAPVWGFVGASNSADNLRTSDTTVNLQYTYLVPCLKYTTVTK